MATSRTSDEEIMRVLVMFESLVLAILPWSPGTNKSPFLPKSLSTAMPHLSDVLQ